jgi:hypothetical protein
MCCSKRVQERRLLQQELFHQASPLEPRQRGCCGSRRAQRRAYQIEAANNTLQPVSEISTFQQRALEYRQHRPTMAGMLVIGLGMGAEKLGRKISDKRLERKEKKAAVVHNLLICFS